MNKLYLHIGMGKTGTSAIQYFLYENRELLQSQNILYPVTDGYFIDKSNEVTSGNASDIINHILNEEYDDIFEYLDELLKQSNVLISSELLVYYFGKNIELFYDIVEQFNATVILYVRKQDEFYNSLVNQWTKLKNLTDTDCLKEVHENYFYIMKIINNINSDKLLVRPYEKLQFKNENLIDDFLECLGLNLNSEFEDKYVVSTKKINNSLSPIAYKLKQEYNFKFKDVTNKEFINVLIEYSKQNNNKYNNVSVVSKQEREELLEVYSAFNASLAMRFLQRLDGKFFVETNKQIVHIEDESLYSEKLIKEAYEFIKNNYQGSNLNIDELFNQVFDYSYN